MIPYLDSPVDLLIQYWEYITPIVGATLAAIGWAWRHRPVPTPGNVNHYIDDELNRRVERREFALSWGLVIYNSMSIDCEIPFESEVDLTGRGVAGEIIDIPKSYFTYNASDSGRRVRLVKRGYYLDNKLTELTLHIFHHIDPSYRTKIDAERNPNHLIIKNLNEERIKNYRFRLPQETPLSQVVPTQKGIKAVDISAPFGNITALAGQDSTTWASQNVTIFLIVEEVPACDHISPGIFDILTV